MKRGEIWTISGGPAYAGKPRPSVIVQDDPFLEKDSITVAGITTELLPTLLFRVPVMPNDMNGLREQSHIMADKVTTVQRHKIGRRVGELDPDDIERLDAAIMVFLGLA